MSAPLFVSGVTPFFQKLISSLTKNWPLVFNMRQAASKTTSKYLAAAIATKISHSYRHWTVALRVSSQAAAWRRRRRHGGGRCEQKQKLAAARARAQWRRRSDERMLTQQMSAKHACVSNIIFSTTTKNDGKSRFSFSLHFYKYCKSAAARLRCSRLLC